VLLCAAALASACTGGGRAAATDGRPAATTTSAPVRRAAPTTTTTTAPPTTTTPPAPVVLAIGGDVHFEGPLATRLDASPATALAPVAPLLAGADVAIVNLETAVGVGGTPAAKQFTFVAPPTAMVALREAGVDVASMANNHGLDRGAGLVEQSLEAAEGAGLPIVGLGRDDAEAWTAWRTEVRGVRIGVLAATQVLDRSLERAWTAGPGSPGMAVARPPDRIVEAVTALAAEVDVVVAILHWGIETHTCPSADQRALAGALVDAGADVVAGGHAHRLQGAGRLDGAVVAYGLGNFVFLSRSAEASASGVLEVAVTRAGVEGYRWVPARISAGLPRPLEGAEAAAAVAAWDGLRACTDLAP
jgi:poly-gamma-glutamate synthesis protein (capsule biosynthesis protein)